MKLLLCVIVLLCVCDRAISRPKESRGLTVSVATDGTYYLLVNGVQWLTSGETFFWSGGHRFSSANQALKLINSTGTSGDDAFGQWQSTDFTYNAGGALVMASIKTYNKPDLPLVVFSQKYLTPAPHTSAQDADDLISGFPSFKVEATKNASLGYICYAGDQSGYSKLTTGRWEEQTERSAGFNAGMEGGPLVLFDEGSNALVVSPLSQFMAASNTYTRVPLTSEMQWGIMGMVDDVPKDYQVDFIVYYSDAGINAAMQAWGGHLKKRYSKDDLRDEDLALTHMGYWTDNGAYYYYNTEDHKNYQQTMVDLVNSTENSDYGDLPFKYVQYDSWWYYKGLRQGTKRWAPMKTVFPDGFSYVNNKTGLPFAAHNRYWDSDVVYANFNNGQFNFIKDHQTGYTLPDDPAFWPALFNSSAQWGHHALYEQDWLSIQTVGVAELKSDLQLGRRWLMQMGEAASKHGVSIQYCMAFPRHLLQSLEIPAVTQARASQDFHPGGKQWDIGVTSMLLDALGLAPSKDTFWTTSTQPGNTYKSEDHTTTLNHLVATLSTGPVGPGDAIGLTNGSLLMKCCDYNGRILAPQSPMTATDDMLKKKVFPDYAGPEGQVWSTFIDITYAQFAIIMATEITNIYTLTPSSLNLNGDQFVYGPDFYPTKISDSTPIIIGNHCSMADPCVYYISPQLGVPVYNSTVILLGEKDKWVPLSPKRFTRIDTVYNDPDLVVDLNVSRNETVSFFYQQNGQEQNVECVNELDEDRQATIFIWKAKCVFH